MNTKTRRCSTLESKLGCPRGVFCLSSVPSEYLFLCARRKFVFNEKTRRNLLIVYVYYQPNSCTTHTEREWAGRTFLRQQKKFLQPTCSGCSTIGRQQKQFRKKGFPLEPRYAGICTFSTKKN